MSLIPAEALGAAVRLGNHEITTDEAALGFSPDIRVPFLDGTTGQPRDPAVVTLNVGRPDGTELNYAWPDPGTNGTLVHQSTGRFYIDLVLDQPRRWTWNLSGTGYVQASTGDHDVWVDSSRL